jgi:hypothetical protein
MVRRVRVPHSAALKVEAFVPIVTCPKCNKRYDPGVDEEFEAFSDAGEISLKVVCPACGQWLRLPENEGIPAPAAPPEMLMQMMAQSRLVDDSEESAAPKRPNGRTPEQKP